MRSFPECKSCIMGTVNRIAELCNAEASLQQTIVQTCDQIYDTLDPTLSPAELSHDVFMNCYKLLNNDDPYAAEKLQQNAAALAMHDELMDLVNTADDPLYQALKISVAGNIIDVGAMETYDMHEGIERSLKFDFAINHYEQFKQQINKSKRLLYILDNAGEIVFDAVMLKTIEKYVDLDEITVVVRKRPMLNDVTLADAQWIGFTDQYKVVDSGSEVFGLPLGSASTQFQSLFNSVDMVIAKGMANFETLEGSASRDIFFILMSKCAAISRFLGVNEKDLILRYQT